MKLSFYKYQGTGNDFVIIDNRDQFFPKNNTQLVASFCERRFGIGADGLILLENDESVDFKMVYFNADGAEGSMCGNGGRCLVSFAHFLGIFEHETTFRAVDGLHYATIQGDTVRLKMQDVDDVHEKPAYSFLDTGSPHHVQLVKDLSGFKVEKEGKKLRYGLYGQAGSNINFVEQEDDETFQVRTYERGVEAETYSCGTGVTAVALAMHKSRKTTTNHVNIQTLGGKLSISFNEVDGRYTDVYLIGPAIQVFKGEIICSI